MQNAVRKTVEKQQWAHLDESYLGKGSLGGIDLTAQRQYLKKKGRGDEEGDYKLAHFARRVLERVADGEAEAAVGGGHLQTLPVRGLGDGLASVLGMSS